MHPRMYNMIAERLRGPGGRGIDVVVLEAAVLVEAGWEPLVDEVWVTTAPEDEVVRRVQGRNNLDADAIRARIRAQMPETDRVARADAVIDNSGTLESLSSQVRELWRRRVPVSKEKTFKA